MIRSMPLEGLTNIRMKVGSPIHPMALACTWELIGDEKVYNHVLRLNLKTLRWELVDNYGDIPGVRMGRLLSPLLCLSHTD